MNLDIWKNNRAKSTVPESLIKTGGRLNPNAASGNFVYMLTTVSIDNVPKIVICS